MNNTDKALTDLITKLQEVGFNYGPETLDALIRATYLDGLIQTTIAFILLILFLLFSGLFTYGAVRYKDTPLFLGGIGAIMSFILSFVTFMDNNPLLKLADPQAALYRELLHRIP